MTILYDNVLKGGHDSKMNANLKNCFTPSLNFQINHGQSAPEVKFLLHSSRYGLFLTPSELAIVLRPPGADIDNKFLENLPHSADSRPAADKPSSVNIIRLKLKDANETPEIIGLERLPGKINYFIGNNPANWYTDIPTYAKVKYRSIYPGIDIICYGNQQHLEWDFIVHPGSDPSLIHIDIEGCEHSTLDTRGDLLLTAGGQDIRISRPVIYQKAAGQRNEIVGRYILEDGYKVSFQLDDYDKAKPLVIDPVITFGTYWGGFNVDSGYSIAVDSAGAMYVTGVTYSLWSLNPPGFPVSSDAYQADNPGYYNNAFVTKINAAGVLVYSTYLGGTGDDRGYGIAVDSAGCAYVTGYATSTDFPITANAIQGTFQGYYDAFVTKFNSNGNGLIYSTYLGGTEGDVGYGIAVDSDGNAYVTGYTESSGEVSPPGFPTRNPLQPNNNSNSFLRDAFITKINADASLGYSTYLGGWQNDIGYAIAVDSSGNAYVTGSTASRNTDPPGFPTKNPLQPDNNGDLDVFVTKISADGTFLVYSTYLGGKYFDEGRSIAVDSTGCVYITGFTASLDTDPPGFPTKAPLQPNSNENVDAFVTKINADGSSLIYSTYLGGKGDDRGFCIAVDSFNNAYVTGSTTSRNTNPPGFPTKYPIQPDNNGETDAFLARLKPDGSDLIYSTYLGGKVDDQGSGIAADATGNIYITGSTYSKWTPSQFGPPGFPVQDPLQPDNNGDSDVFILQLASHADLSITKSGSPNPVTIGQNLTYTITITNTGPDPATNVILTDTLPADAEFVSASTGCSQIGGVVTCDLDTIAPGVTTVTIVVKPKKAGVIVNTAAITSRESVPPPANAITVVNPGRSYTNFVIVRDWTKSPPKTGASISSL